MSSDPIDRLELAHKRAMLLALDHACLELQIAVNRAAILRSDFGIPGDPVDEEANDLIGRLTQRYQDLRHLRADLASLWNLGAPL